MTPACTVLIPTHERHHYLERCVRWFRDGAYPIAVADSSREEWRSPLRDAVLYIHVPGGFEAFLPKLRSALRAIETPFVAMCADDDFITFEGLSDCVRYLEAHDDFSFSQGYSYVYQAFGARIVLWPTHYRFHDVFAERWLDRVEQARDTAYYGVHRTAVLRSAIEFLAGCDFGEILDLTPGLLDFSITAYAARRGKFRRCPVPFGLREYSPRVTGVGQRFRTITSRNIPDFYRALFRFLAGEDETEETKARLLALFAADYAGQIAYDVSAPKSRKRFLQNRSKSLVETAEYLYRVATAARRFAGIEWLPSAGIFLSPAYRRFRTFVAAREQAR